MFFSKFLRGFTAISFNYTQWRDGDLFCLGKGYQIQSVNGGQDQYTVVQNPITWEYDNNLEKYVLSWFVNGVKIVSTSGELYEQELAYEEYVSQFYG